jgi:hypothetical protein
MAQHLASLRPVRLDERLTQCCCHHALLGLPHIGQRVLIRAAYEQRGEFAATVELRRLFR